MQAAAKLCQEVAADVWLFSGGGEHRRLCMMARDYCDKVGRGTTMTKPVFLLRDELPSLLEHPDMVAWGCPARTIFMDDYGDWLSYKVSRAFCPPRVVAGNPCLEYIGRVILPWFGKFEVGHRFWRHDGYKTFESMQEFVAWYKRGHRKGGLDAAKVKAAFEKALDEMLRPVRDHFRENSEARDILDAVYDLRAY
ncbi:hypothetical protein ACP70R_027488 [Stipagrostis hirtigluma subsp. patula]